VLRSDLAAAIDQTLLSPTVGRRAARAWMREQREAGFASLCVSPFLVPIAREVLAGTPTRVCTVASFPLGYATTDAKAGEARKLVSWGAQEVDMVANFAALLEDDDDYVRQDVAAVVHAVKTASAGRALVKVILETGYLDDARITRACLLAIEAGADFVKTSTGFGPRGASVEDVRVMREAVGGRLGIKAAGGIRDLETALAMLDAGATRLGTSAGLAILAESDAADR
jgi:deoxyribose-phosphate aldolase